MNIRELERATKIFEKIKDIDKQINELDKFAISVVNGNVKCNLLLSVEDLSQQEIDETIENLSFESMFMPMLAKKNRVTKELKSEITENYALKILAIFLNDKKEQRQKLVNKLESITNIN